MRVFTKFFLSFIPALCFVVCGLSFSYPEPILGPHLIEVQLRPLLLYHVRSFLRGHIMFHSVTEHALSTGWFDQTESLDAIP